ncbi:hypothetical protein B0H12DRAFT_1133693 [Mycena haematopus]|nr:hypothetical protein B0H12DRAFT_1133693 [Mycena haematopus]
MPRPQLPISIAPSHTFRSHSPLRSMPVLGRRTMSNKNGGRRGGKRCGHYFSLDRNMCEPLCAFGTAFIGMLLEQSATILLAWVQQVHGRIFTLSSPLTIRTTVSPRSLPSLWLTPRPPSPRRRRQPISRPTATLFTPPSPRRRRSIPRPTATLFTSPLLSPLRVLLNASKLPFSLQTTYTASAIFVINPTMSHHQQSCFSYTNNSYTSQFSFRLPSILLIALSIQQLVRRHTASSTTPTQLSCQLPKFPAETIQDDYRPLTWDQVIEQVLIPEALSCLIAEDLDLDPEDAITVIQDSTPFGLAYHSDPDDRDRSAAKFREDDNDSLAPFPALSPLNSPRPSPPQLALRTREYTPTPPPIDPASLCNYCDQEFPSEPSEDLLAMGKKLFSRSWAKPLPENPHHRALATITMSVDHCRRHQFERDEMPTALRQGWPLKPNFSRLFHRILDLGVALRALVHKRADSSQFFLATRRYYGNEVSKRSSLSAQYHSNRSSEHGTG